MVVGLVVSGAGDEGEVVDDALSRLTLLALVSETNFELAGTPQHVVRRGKGVHKLSLTLFPFNGQGSILRCVPMWVHMGMIASYACPRVFMTGATRMLLRCIKQTGDLRWRGSVYRL